MLTKMKQYWRKSRSIQMRSSLLQKMSLTGEMTSTLQAVMRRKKRPLVVKLKVRFRSQAKMPKSR